LSVIEDEGSLTLPNFHLPLVYKRGRVHFPEATECDDQVLERAAVLLTKDRKDAKKQGVTPPGQAEFIDLVRAVTRLKDNVQEQCDLLDDISHFALKKHR
jgi:hypothetical protein